MRFLLDTHIWIWLVTGSPRLKIAAVLRDSRNELWVSPLSTWEALTLDRKKRITLSPDPQTWITNAIRGTLEAPLTHEIAAAARYLPLNEEPVNRLLAATAQALNLTLVTQDEQLLGLSNIPMMANR